MGRRCPSALAVLIVVAAVIVGGCGTSSTVTESPSPIKCQVSLATPPALDAGGGTGSFAVTTQPECAWNASTSVNWISALSPTSSQGAGRIDFRVAPNDAASPREADIVVNGEKARVSQRGACRFDVSPSSQGVAVDGGPASVTVAAMSECAWTATTDVSWISLSPPTTGNGNGTVSFTVARNSGAERTGSVTIAGQRSAITQASAASPPPACTYSISPTSQNVAALGGTGTVSVTAGSTCGWAASSGAAWITITSGAGGTGNGSVSYAVAANLGAQRTGTLTVAGQTVTVNQAAAASPPPPPPPPPSCTYSISPMSQSFPALGGSGTVSVTTDSSCAWTASTNTSWINITSGTSGTGNGSVAFNVAVNLVGQRTGTLTIAGQTFTVTQAGVLLADDFRTDSHR